MPVAAQDVFQPFVVKAFRVEGAQSIADGTIYNYLPINIGDTIDEQRIQEAIRALYATDFFKDIELRRDGDTLVINVVERPKIAAFTYDGNNDFKDEDLDKMLKDTDMTVGKTFDQSLLEEITQFLTEQYYSRGKYAAKIEPTVEEVPGNRVNVHIQIDEGKRARIREINIVGNTAFDEKDLLAGLKLQTPKGLMGKFSKKDRYSKEDLQADLETLTSYYMDRGYADFRIPDVSVSISPDKTDIFITINVDEGDVYTVSSVDLATTKDVVPDEVLRANFFVQPDQPFSQQRVTFTEDAIKGLLGGRGYAFADVQTLPELDEENKTVALTFFVDPKNVVYVRRINFNGAEGSKDEVFRRELRQLEGGILSNAALDTSKERISRLPFVEDVDYKTDEVPGSPDLVDVNFDIKEGLPGTMGGSIGYSEAQGVVLGGDFAHSNFLGTGNRVQVNLNGGKYYTVYGFNYTQPYWTDNGISRQIALTYQDVTQFSSVTSDFSTKTVSAGMTFGLPTITDNQTLRLGFSYQSAELLMSIYSSQQAQQWVRNNGRPFELYPGSTLYGTHIDSIDLVAGWGIERRNRTLFPDQGMRASVSLQASVPGSDVEYYVAQLNVEKFFPLTQKLKFRINSQIDYGDAYGSTTALPPYKNFFGGGPDTIRGYKENYLGPRDSFGNPNGGNLLIANSFELILPTPAKFGAAAQMALFIDSGGVFSTGGVDFYDRLGDKLDTGFSYDKLKSSYGIGVQWLSPMGLLRFSYAVPLNADEETDRFFKDQTEGFQFSIGQAF